MSPTESQGSVKKPDEPIQLIDLAAQRRYLGDRLDKAVARVMDHGKYILGPEVQSFERQLAEYTGARHAIGVSNGTDALAIVLMAWQLRTSDAVLVPDFTFAATAEVVAWLGAHRSSATSIRKPSTSIRRTSTPGSPPRARPA
jgi:histidinol-phosphate/aromatic aminotransferase/cobyric acid decarboxylase-like protein